MKKLLVLSAAAAFVLSAQAQAGSAGGAINQEWPATPGTVLIQETITLGAMSSVESISIDLAHTWGADLDVTLIAPNGVDFFDLMFGEVDQGGSGNFDMGLAPNDGTLANVATYTFVETGGLTVWDDTSGVAPGGTYDANAWLSGAALVAGDWTLQIVDNVGGDGGAVGSYSIDFTPLPTPAALALFGIAGIAGTRRRRA